MDEKFKDKREVIQFLAEQKARIENLEEKSRNAPNITTPTPFGNQKLPKEHVKRLQDDYAKSIDLIKKQTAIDVRKGTKHFSDQDKEYCERTTQNILNHNMPPSYALKEIEQAEKEEAERLPGDDIPPPGDGDGPQPEPDQLGLEDHNGPEPNGPGNDQGLTAAFNDVAEKDPPPVAENKEASTITGQDLSQDQDVQQGAQKSKFVDMDAYRSANKDIAPVDQNMDTTAQQQDVGDTVDKTAQEDVNEDKDPGQVQSRFFDAQTLKEEQKQIEQAEQSKETTEPEDKALQEERPDFSDIRDSIGQDEIGEQDRDTSPEQSLDDRTDQEIDQEHEVDELGRQGQEEQPDFSDIRNSIGMDGFDDQSPDMDNSPDQEGPDNQPEPDMDGPDMEDDD